MNTLRGSRKSSVRLACVLVALSTAACTTIPEAEPSAESTRELKVRVLELQRKAAIAEVELARLREQLARLELASPAELRAERPASAWAEPAAPPLASPVAEPVVASDEPQLEAPTTLPPPTRTELVDPGVGDEGLESQDLEPVYSQPAPRVTTEVEQFEQPPASLGTSPASPQPGRFGDRPPVTSDAQTLYDKGYTLFHQSRYVDAESVFQQFLQSHGDTDLGDNAQFWIGESRFSRRDWEGALAAYRETVERYPTGNKVPDAMLKIGETLEELGDLESARITYDEVVEQFPFSAAATTALEHLAEN